MNTTVFMWLVGAEWRTYPLRVALSTVAIAVGVALGFAVHLVNSSALGEIAGALAIVSGNADAEVVATTSAGFSEDLYPRLAGVKGVLVSPVVEANLALADGAGTLRILGLDVLRAKDVTPALLPEPHADAEPTALFDSDAVFVSGAAQALADKAGQGSIDVLVGGAPLRLRILGRVPGVGPRVALAVMDIGAAQWRLGMLGHLSRVDVRLPPGQRASALSELARIAGPNARIVTPEDESQRTDSLSRAYRVNLDMVALMALFTGAFLIYSSQSLSVARRTGQLALLRVLGTTRLALMTQIGVEGLLLGVLGSLCGIGGGIGIASLALRVLGGDLGGGYFSGTRPELVIEAGPAAAFFALGIAAALVGSWIPARQAARAQPAVALRSSDDLVDPRAKPDARWGVGLIVAGALCAFLPAVSNIALFGYLSMAALLFGGIAVMPWLARTTLRPLAAGRLPALPLSLAIQRLWGAPTQGTVALCGVVAATSLVVAMGIMVTSFRGSVDTWLQRLLPAQLYLHSTAPVGSVSFDAATKEALLRVPGVDGADFVRSTPLQLAPGRPPVVLVARSIASAGAADTLTLVASAPLGADVVPVWVSEAMVDLYGWKVGALQELPFVEKTGARTQQAVGVAGVYRDYARQTGTIVMRAQDYERLTGDTSSSDAGLHVAADADLARVEKAALAALPAALAAHVEVSRPADIRRASLRIFDRSFAVTYLLEGVAIVIGLLGVAATFSAQTVARAREFGMLRHIGVRRVEIVAMLGCEGALLGAMGVGAGLVLGGAMSQILIHVVNPQSFHWTMDTHVPWLLLVQVALLLIVAATGAALVAGRQALSQSAVLAVREDW